jgi:hypothetical protein
MWVRGQVVNRISDPSERSVGSAILVVPGAPQPQPTPTITTSPSVTPSVTPTEVPSPTATPTATPTAEPTPQIQSLSVAEGSAISYRCAVLKDAGSTGGLLDYLARRGMMKPFANSSVRQALEIFRGDRDCDAVATRRS